MIDFDLSPLQMREPILDRAINKLEETIMSTPALFSALIKAQSEFPALVKDAANPHFKSRYVSLEKAIDTIMPILNRNGLTVIQTFVNCDGIPGMRTILAHVDGGMIEGTMPMPPVKGGAQENGSNATYARRYGLLAIVGIAPSDEDDDGNSATEHHAMPTAQEAQKLLADRAKMNIPTSDKARESVAHFDTLPMDQRVKLLAYLRSGK